MTQMNLFARSAATKAAAAILFVTAASVCFAAAPDSAAGARPNVLIIVTDDQRAGTLNVMPSTVRWFQRRGRTYTRAFVTTPLCCPSRASIFTGRYAHNHGVKNNGRSARSLPQDLTLQRYLSDAGYTTAIVGKYLNSWPLRRNPPHFDRWAIVGTHPYRNSDFNVDGTVSTFRGYTTNVMASKAVRLLRRFEATDSQPWFLYIAPTAPHRPSVPARRYTDSAVPPWSLSPAVREIDRSDKPPWVWARSVSLDEVGPQRADELRTLMSVDDLVRRIAETLGYLRERRRTIAFYLSDNGYMWGEHGMPSKMHPYTDSIRIPLMLRWPGRVSPGSRHWRFSTNADIAPTVLDAAGVAPAEPMDGKSLLRSWTREHLFMEYFKASHHPWIPSWQAIRTRRFHYIEYYSEDRSEVVFREYYRLDRDPWQLTNVLHDGNPTNNPRTRRLHRLLQSYSACSASSCP